MSTLLASVLLLLSTVAAAQKCPTDCECGPGGLRVDCPHLSAIPAELPEGALLVNVSGCGGEGGGGAGLQALLPGAPAAAAVRVLYLQGCHLDAVPEQAFHAWHQLWWLSLARNSIQRIDERAFIGALRLESLTLSDNPLGPYPPRLEDIPSLRVMQLQRCNISEIPVPDSFLGDCCPLMTELWLSYNLISHIPNGSFTELPGLQYLYLSNNRLINIESGALNPLNQLLVLDLSSNLLQELNVDLFVQQTSLDVLYLSHNRLESLEIGIFSPLMNLRVLHLDHNKIREINPGLFTGLGGLKKLYLENNDVEDVSFTSFEELSNLTHLYLANNAFPVLSVCSLRGLVQLQYLRLFGGLLQSDCNLWNLHRWTSDRGINLLAPSVTDVTQTCNITVCPMPEELHETFFDWQSTVGLTLLIGVPLAVIAIAAAATVACCRRRNCKRTGPARYTSPDAGYDTVAESSRSTTETDATIIRTIGPRYGREFCGSGSVSYPGPAAGVAVAAYSTSEDEEEALLTHRQRHRPPQHASLRVPRPGARRVLPRPASLQAAPPNYHLSDTEPQSSTLSDCSDSGNYEMSGIATAAPALPLQLPPRLPPRPPPRSATTVTVGAPGMIYEDDERRGLVV
ncbi:leucine-rich repeat-containing protein 15-like isoform X2 [Schistocerca serialis cubense]|nr:leucine-rich repeat-containing protein 15-like isoform X2 [Schistocerca serialis cubense]